jgi:putative hydrolase of the HAD superfamily
MSELAPVSRTPRSVSPAPVVLGHAVRAVLFDLRGTLVDPEGSWRVADALRLRLLRSAGALAADAELARMLELAVAEVNALTFRRNTYFDQDRLVLMRAAERAGVSLSESTLDDFEQWRNRAFSRAIRTYPDVLPSIRTLKARGALVGCVADGTREWTLRLLEGAGLAEELDVVVGSAESGEVKATGAALRLACARLGVTPEETLFVGDRLDKDVEMAHAAGAAGVLLDRRGAGLGTGRSIASLAELTDRSPSTEEAPCQHTSTT